MGGFFLKSFYKRVLSVIFISCVGIVVYANTFQCSAHLDDEFYIFKNFAIRNIQDLVSIWNYYPCRFVTFFSLALNYHFDGQNVFGYHLFNLGVHLVTAILVWWLTLMTLSTPAMKASTLEKNVTGKKPFQKSNRNAPVLKIPPQEPVISDHANLIALLVGLVFVSHPVQTEAVTYIWQRTASMAAMFYLASLCFYVKARLVKSPSLFYYPCSLIFAVTAMFTKEMTITLPLTIFLYEFCFLKPKQGLNYKYLIPFFFVLFIIPLTVWLLPKSVRLQEMEGVISGFRVNSPWHYFLTQLRVMVTYVRLVFVPIHQNLDYDYPVYKNLFELPVLGGLLFITAILYGAKRLFSKYRLVSFAIFWFFLTLLPESSVTPLADVIFEHRLYLPLVGYSLFLVSAGYYLLGKRSIKTMGLVLMMIIVCNAVLTYQRNKVWIDEFTLWSDTVQKSPHKARPYNNRGNAYDKMGKITQALSDYNKALEIDPQFHEAYHNRGLIYYNRGDLTQALSDYNKAIEFNPKLVEAYGNRGVIYYKQGDYTKAMADYNKTIELNPNVAEAYYNRGAIYDKANDFSQAVLDYNKAIEIDPKMEKAYHNRGLDYFAQGDLSQAMSDYSKAIELNPNFAEVYDSRGLVYYKQNNPVQAIADYNKAIELNPKMAEAYDNRGVIYNNQNNYTKALSDYNKVIELNPNLAEAYNNRGGIYYHQGNYIQAMSDYNKAIELNPKLTDAYNSRGCIYYVQGNLTQAMADYTKVIELNPQYQGAYYNRGLIYGKQGDLAKSVSDLTRAIELVPSYAEAYNSRAIAYYMLKEYDKARTDAQKAEKLGATVNPALLNN